MPHRLLIGGLAAIALTQIASAADLPRKAPPAAPPPPPAFSWTGFYIGGHIGGAWSGSDESFANLFSGPGALVSNPPNLPFDTGGNGLIGGVQLGYNWQFNRNWLIGVEGDFSWTNVDGSQTYNPIPPGPGPVAGTPSFMTMSRDVNWLASIRGRLGYTWDRLLIYGTGGVAWINADYFGIESRAGGSFIDVADFKSTKTGWVAGGGVEYALAPNWTVRGEYLYYSTNGVTATSTPIPPTPAFVIFDWDRTNLHVFRFAFNYTFDWGQAR